MGGDLRVLYDDIDLWMTRSIDRNSANVALFTVSKLPWGEAMNGEIVLSKKKKTQKPAYC